jgi:hypothetical protein
MVAAYSSEATASDTATDNAAFFTDEIGAGQKIYSNEFFRINHLPQFSIGRVYPILLGDVPAST